MSRAGFTKAGPDLLNGTMPGPCVWIPRPFFLVFAFLWQETAKPGEDLFLAFLIWQKNTKSAGGPVNPALGVDRVEEFALKS